jgi:flavin reductase (DIM6/NTAB) family NADH-FMN oxidoreductase RutF
MVVEDISQQRRRAVRQVASGVAVLTFWYGTDAHGTTVSAVTAVSRDPLLVGVCLQRDSLFARLVGSTGQRFGINVLGAPQAHLASWFADPQRPPGLAQFDYLDWEPDTFSGAPLITGSLARLGCRLTDCIEAGDHHLLMAEVMSGVAGDGAPLLSFAGQLHDGLLRSLPARQAHPATRRTVSAARHT